MRAEESGSDMPAFLQGLRVSYEALREKEEALNRRAAELEVTSINIKKFYKSIENLHLD